MQAIKLFNLKQFSKRDIYALVLLCAIGFLGNYFRWSLFFGIDFIFGSIAVWFVVCLYGIHLGTIAGFISAICTYLIWGHPYSIVTYTLEAFVVGWLFHRRFQHNLVLASAIFWLLIGMPLVWLFYAVILHIDFTQALIILLKQPVNGIFNALIASLLLTYLPIPQWLRSRSEIKALSLQQTLFNLLITFASASTLTLIFLTSYQVVDEIKSSVQINLKDTSRYLSVEVRTWYERSLSDLYKIRNLVALTSGQSDALNQLSEFVKLTLPDVRHIHVLNATGRRILDTHLVPDDVRSILNERRYFEQIRSTLQPTLIDVARLDDRSSHVILGVPILRQKTFVGVVLCELSLDQITSLVRDSLGKGNLQATVVDQQQRIIFSTNQNLLGLEQWNWRESGQVNILGHQMYHWMPTAYKLLMARWSHSTFVKESLIKEGLPWTLVVQIPAKPYVQQIEQTHTRNLAILLLVSSVAPIASAFVSRRLTKPLLDLAVITTDLPNKLIDQETIPWQENKVTEFALLTRNFRLMAASLQQKFLEIRQANETLEQRVQERTKAFQETNTALRESEARLRQMAENIEEVFWMASVDKRELLYVSPAYETIWGRTCKSLYANPFSFFEAIHPDDRSYVQAAFPGQAEKAQAVEYRILRPDGAIRWIWDRSFPIYNNANEVYRIVGVAQDITERKQAEDTIRQQAERDKLLSTIALQMRQSLKLDEILNTTVAGVRQFLQTDRVIVYQFQPDWSGVVVVESVAEGCQSILGMTFTETYFVETHGRFYRQGRIQVIDDIQTSNLDECHAQFLRQLQVKANLVVPILQGDALWGLLVVHHCSAPRSWQPSEIDFLRQLATQSAIAIHQSELYRHEQRLNFILEQQVEERTAQLQQALRYEAMIQRITDKVRDSLDEAQILQTAVEELVHGLEVLACDTALFDSEQGLMKVSHTYSARQIISQPGDVLMTSGLDIYVQLLQGRSLQFCDLEVNHAHAHSEISSIFACPIIDDQGLLGELRLFRSQEAVFNESEIRVVLQVANQCAIAIRQARLYQAAQTQVQALEELNQLKDDFLSTVSHELRTPISNMKMAIHMLKVSDVTARRDRYLEILQNECAREADLINDLLDLQRLASGTRVLEPEPIDLQQWLDELIDPFLERTQNRQQILQLNIASNLPTISSDRACLSRIVAELLNNACKYTPPHQTITLNVQMVSLSSSAGHEADLTHIEYAEASLHLQIQVCNSGVEIPARELPHIFEKFYRIPGVDRWKQGGTGLGLALVQKLAEHLGGTISVESAANHTCFTVYL